ncbi:hypothetical protein QPK32_07345 [Massilia sp. YIM B02763]|uniref:hypothetical protein n=1 Tax=Massilia sp. YIM B02763 TaxID=3050130 RepID=UPI0025B6CCE7|nr:hypothetical protein [Massilia sp. YIM B02763]MDN4052887.1 hypothetical protein [Massilia sp. YIM B02763]
MKERRVSHKNKGDTQLHKAKFIVGCALIGTVVAGAFFGWIPMDFDVRIVGAGIGAAAGAAAGHLA